MTRVDRSANPKRHPANLATPPAERRARGYRRSAPPSGRASATTAASPQPERHSHSHRGIHRYRQVHSPPQSLLRRPVEPRQYTSEDYTQELDDARVLASVGSVGDAYDNALAESFVDSYKTELIADRVWRTHTQLELATVEYVAWFNTRRLHSALGNIPPHEHEQRHATTVAADPERSRDPAAAGILSTAGAYDPFGVVSDPPNQPIALTR